MPCLSQPSQIVGSGGRLGSSLEELPKESLPEDPVSPPDSGVSRQTLTDRQDSLGSLQTSSSSSAHQSSGETRTSGPDVKSGQQMNAEMSLWILESFINIFCNVKYETAGSGIYSELKCFQINVFCRW